MTKPTKVTGLFRNKSGNGYGVKLREDVTLRAGSRLLLFKVKDEFRKPNGPELELLVAVDDGEESAAVNGGGRRVQPQQSRAAVEAQPPADWNDRLGDEIPF